MSRETLHVYPRGFAGHMLTVLPVKEKSVTEAFRTALQYDVRIFHQESRVANYDMACEALSVTQRLKTPEYYTYQFKEAVLRHAMIVFGTRSITDWLEVHATLPGVTKTHLAFMEDTVRYALGYRENRRLMVPQWQDMLTMGIDIEPLEHSDWKDLALLASTPVANGLGRTPMSFEHFVSLWAMRGIDDIVMTLNVLFGRYQ